MCGKGPKITLECFCENLRNYKFAAEYSVGKVTEKYSSVLIIGPNELGRDLIVVQLTDGKNQKEVTVTENTPMQLRYGINGKPDAVVAMIGDEVMRLVNFQLLLIDGR